jgi:hypothetical protein
MVKLITPLDTLSKDMLDYFKTEVQKALGTMEVDCILVTKVNDQVQISRPVLLTYKF